MVEKVGIGDAVYGREYGDGEENHGGDMLEPEDVLVGYQTMSG